MMIDRNSQNIIIIVKKLKQKEINKTLNLE